MRPYLTLVRRELGGFYVSLTGYLIIGAIQFLLGLCFIIILQALDGKPFDMPVTEAFFNNGLFWLILLLAPPVITMRSFAHEKFSGTYETLMTTPVSDGQVVMAKFSGALIFFLSAWLPLIAYPFILRKYSVDLTDLDLGALGGTMLGLFLYGSLYLSIGCFASAMTRSQIIAAMTTFVIGLSFFLASFLHHILPVKPGWQSALFEHISQIEHMKDFSRGLVDIRQVTFYVSLTIFFLFLTHKAVESRRWK